MADVTAWYHCNTVLWEQDTVLWEQDGGCLQSLAWFGDEQIFVLRAHLQVQEFSKTESQPLGYEMDSKDFVATETQRSLSPWKTHNSFSDRNWLWAWAVGMQRRMELWSSVSQRQTWEPVPTCCPGPACPGEVAPCGSSWAVALAEHSVQGARDCPVLGSKDNCQWDLYQGCWLCHKLQDQQQEKSQPQG